MKDVLNGTETELYYAHNFYEPTELSEMFFFALFFLVLNVKRH